MIWHTSVNYQVFTYTEENFWNNFSGIYLCQNTDWWYTTWQPDHWLDSLCENVHSNCNSLISLYKTLPPVLPWWSIERGWIAFYLIWFDFIPENQKLFLYSNKCGCQKPSPVDSPCGFKFLVGVIYQRTDTLVRSENGCIPLCLFLLLLWFLSKYSISSIVVHNI